MNSVQYKDYLQHYGVKGMKWGIRRYENYDGTLTSAGKERYDDAGGAKKKGLSDNTKKNLKKAAIIGGSAAAIGLAAYGAYKLGPSLFKDTREYGNPTKASEFLVADRLPKMDKSLIGTEEDFMAMNSGIIKTPLTNRCEILKGASTNCSVSTTAWELRQRGFDVQPKELINGFSDEQIADFWSGDRKFDNIGKSIMGDIGEYKTNFKPLSFVNTVDMLTENEAKIDSFAASLSKKMLDTYPEGARGNITTGWLFSGGHSMCWEIKNGEFKVRDAQIHKYDVDIKEVFKNARLDTVSVLRTDDLEPDMNRIRGLLRTDSNKAHLVKNLPKAAIGLGLRSNEGRLAILGGYSVHKIKTHMDAQKILDYKKAYPNTDLTDKEILNLLSYEKG